MKTYKIGNKEIEEFDVNELNHDYTAKKYNQLLEALTDKEESKDLAFDDFLENKYGQREEELKQEECEHDWVGFSAIECSRCRKRDDKPKQSTSLKEGITEIVSHSISVHTITDSVLKLIQSHLLKEIEKVEATQYVKKDSELSQTYTQAKLDIIKIINNLK